MSLIPKDDYTSVYRMNIHWAVANLAHFVFILFMFETIRYISVVQVWCHTLHVLLEIPTHHRLSSGRYNNQNTVKYKQILISTTKAQPHQLWILLIVKYISNALLSWITYQKPAKRKLFFALLRPWGEHLNMLLVSNGMHPLPFSLLQQQLRENVLQLNNYPEHVSIK